MKWFKMQMKQNASLLPFHLKHKKALESECKEDLSSFYLLSENYHNYNNTSCIMSIGVFVHSQII